ncbi:MAG: DUF6265 family protein [Ginsengibacter sp.]
MKYPGTLSVVFLMNILTGFTQQKTSSELRSLNWLIGTWQMEKKNGLLTESWQQTNDSTFDESSYLQKTSGERKLLENVQIVFRENNLYYIPTVSEQNNRQPVKFLITSSSNKMFIAENPEHDFPKRIVYEMISPDSLHARIDGGPSMPDKKSDFYYSRQKISSNGLQ